MDLTTASQIIVSMLAASGGAPVTVDMTNGVSIIGSAGAGRIAVDITAEKSALLLVNPSPTTMQDLQVEVIDSNSEITIIILPQALNVVAPDFPIV